MVVFAVTLLAAVAGTVHGHGIEACSTIYTVLLRVLSLSVFQADLFYTRWIMGKAASLPGRRSWQTGDQGYRIPMAPPLNHWTATSSLNPVNSNVLTCGIFWAIKTLVTVLPFFLILIEVTGNGLYLDRNHGIVFSPEVLAHLARLQISLSLDLYGGSGQKSTKRKTPMRKQPA